MSRHNAVPHPADEQASPEEFELAQALETYLAALEAGQAPDPEHVLAQHPAIADRLRVCLASLRLVEGGAGSFAGPGPEAADSDAQPQVLGDFRIVRQVGRGGMGVVYEAEQVSLGRRVALKVLPLAGVLDGTQLQRFQNEARAAAGLHHSNIVPVYFVGCERGVHFYAMQFIDGQSLAAVLALLRQQATSGAGEGAVAAAAPNVPAAALEVKGTASTQPAALLSTASGARGQEYFRAVAELGVQAAEALDYGHRVGVVHRDVKPANLLLDTAGRLWVTDFGLAHVQGAESLTATGELVGTLRYMSPEQALGKRMVIDHRTDVYSLGATLYELLTLRPAFDGSDRQELLRQIAFEEPVPPRRLERAVPAELETIVLKALEKRPEDRYVTAQDLAHDLHRFLEHKPIQAKRPGMVQRARKWLRRNRAVAVTLTGAGSVVLALVFIGLLVNNRMLDQERVQTAQQRDRAEEGRQKAQQAEEQAKKAAAKAEAINRFWVDDLLAEAAPEKNPVGSKVTVKQLLDKAAGKIAHAFPGQPEVEAAVSMTLGTTYRSLSLYPQAEPQLRRAVDLRREHLGPDHPDTLHAVRELAIVLKDQGKYAEAERLNRQNLEAYRRVLGPDDPGTLRTANDLALLLMLEGKLQEAEPLYRQNLEAYVRLFGPDQTETLTAESNLASLLEDLGKVAEAESLYRHSLEASVRVLGPDHPDTLIGVNNLASLLGSRGKLAEAEALLRQNLEARLRVLGPDHHYTLHTVNNLARVLQDQGKLAEAEPLFRRFLEGSQRVLGPEHPDTLHATNNLAALLYARGKLAEAEPLLRKNLDASRRVLGANHPLTMSAVNNLARLLRETGKLAEAEQLLRQNLEAARRTFGPGHPRTALALSLLGWVLTDLDKPREAEPLLRESLEIYEKGPSKGSWPTADVRSLLGACLLAQGQYPEAEPLLLQGYRELTKAPGTPPKTLDEARGRLLRLYEAWGKPDKAAAWRVQRAEPASQHKEDSPQKK
jgi:serine/threonine protein kinase/Flp pilus assembly protein TadD